MKLFFAVLAAMLAAGFISWLVLSMAQVAHHRDALKKKNQDSSMQHPN